jgi:methyl coenzyme M reductase subunit C
MGAQGNGKGFPGDLVLDAGALIAFERGDRRIKAILRTSFAMRARMVVPASVLAQAWRGGPGAAPLARLLGATRIDPLVEERAKEIGLRLGERRANDVADAHVVCCAAEFRAAIVTSDPGDLEALAMPGEQVAVIPL